MPDPLHISYGDYSVIRLPDEPRSADSPVTYAIFRADGTSLCCGVSWADVERLIEHDEAKRVAGRHGPVGSA